MQKSATTKLQVGIILASVAVICVPMYAYSAVTFAQWFPGKQNACGGIICTDLTTENLYLNEANGGTDHPNGQVITAWEVDFDDIGVDHHAVFFYSDTSCTTYAPFAGFNGLDTQPGINKGDSVFYESTEVKCMKLVLYDAFSVEIATYEFATSTSPIWNITNDYPGSSSTSTSATSTAAEVSAATGVAALGFISFIGGFTSTLWMWKRFLG